MTQRPRLDAYRALYFLYYGAMGLMIPFLAPFMESRGIGGESQGWLLAGRTALAIVAQPLIGVLADRFGIGRALRAAALLTAAAFSIALIATTTTGFAGIFVLLAIGVPASGTLLDAGTISELETCGLPASGFSRVRLWGSAGFALAALGFGLLWSGAERARVAPAAVAGMAILSAAALAVSLFAPARSRLLSERRPQLSDVARILRVRGVPSILITAALQWVTFTGYNSFFGAHVEKNVGGPEVVGLAIAVAVGCEIVVMVFAPRWLPRIPVRLVLCVSAAAGVLRWSATAMGSAPLVIAAQSLHALGYAAFYLAATDAMVRRTPPELRASAQSVLTALGTSTGAAIGYLFAGRLYAIDSGRTLFFAVAAFSVVPAISALFIPDQDERATSS